MKKLLSIVIPTYNKELYLSLCVESVLGTRWDNQLEIIIVNDGSTDKSLAIAGNLKEQYPDIINIIDKENGNYGSTINAAMPVAQGKYIKILDADDQFDKEELCKLLDVLDKSDCDLILTYFHFIDHDLPRQFEQSWNIEYNKKYSFNEMLASIDIRSPFLMYHITYRTQLLKDCKYKQTEGVSYTDTEWTFYPLFYVKNVMFVNAYVYKYFYGIPGQTMSEENYIKGTEQMAHLLIAMQEYYTNFIQSHGQLDSAFQKYVIQIQFRDWYIRIYKVSLMYMNDTLFDPNLMLIVENSLEKLGPELERIIKKRCRIIYILHINYFVYWRKTKKRLPSCLRRFLINHASINLV